jgi:hypothetical protein
MAETTLSSVHVDRVEELARFEAMIAGTGTAHVLLIQAEPGMGKSSLLREFWDKSAAHSRFRVDFKPRTHSVEGVLGELSSQNRPAFTRFYERLERVTEGGPLVYMNNTDISRSQLDIRLQRPDSTEERELRRQVLTQAFFSDLVDANPQHRTTVMVFDTYEAANEEVKDWLTRLLLTGVRGYRWLTVVVAGQTIPQLGIGWDDWVLEQTLRPLGPEHVGEYLRQVKLQLSEHEITIIYQATAGIPLDLSTSAGRILRTRGPTHG